MICLLRRAGIRLAMLLLAGMAPLVAAGVTITSILPDAGPPAGGTSISINGTGFATGATVTIGGVPATAVFVSPPNIISCTTPASGTLGAQPLIVTNADLSTQSATYSYTSAPAPSISGIAPEQYPPTGGSLITISGANFVSGATVTISGNAATSVNVTGPGTITCITPAVAVGAGDLVVYNPDTQLAFVPQTFYAAPTVSGVSPASGPSAGGTALTITGTGFLVGATVAVGGNPAGAVLVASATSISCTTPPGAPGAGAVVVANPDTQPSNAGFAFTFVASPAPVVATVAPIGGPLAGGTTVTISGSGFQAGATVAFGGVAVTPLAVAPGTISCVAPGPGSGPVAVVVTNPDTQPSNSTVDYAYEAAPAVTGVAPGLGPVAGGTAITITGTGFLAGATVSIGGTAAGAVAVASSTSISCTTPAGAAGPAALVVANPDTQAASGTFTYQGGGPAISSVSPALAPAAGGTALTITGSGFLGSSVTIGGAPATAVVVVSPAQITCVSPAGTPGPADVVVTNSDLTSVQTGTSGDAFVYQGPLPTITQIAPEWGPVGTPITITGTNFQPGAQVAINRVAASSVAVVDAQTVTCAIPGGLAGFVTVTVTNPDTTSAIAVDGFNIIGDSDLSAHRCGGSHGISALLLAPFIAWRLLVTAARRRRAAGACADRCGGPPPPAA